MSAYPSERQLPLPNPGSYNNHIVLEDLAPRPWQNDTVPAPRFVQKKPRKERSDKGKRRKKSGDMGNSGQDENEHPNGQKSVNPSAASQQRKRRRRASLDREVLAPNISVVIGAHDREGANDTLPKDQQTAFMAINHHPDHLPEIADHFTGVANISNAAADLPHDEPASQGKHRKKSGDMGNSGQDENEHPNGQKSVNPSAASQQRKRRRRASLDREVLAPNIPKEFGSFSPLSPTAIKEVRVFFSTCAVT
jgi:hypothetical protein